LDNIDGRVPFADAVGDLLGICSLRLVDPLWKIREAVTSTGKKARELKFVMRERIRKIVERRRLEGVDGDKKDMLQLLLEATDDEGNPLTEDYLVDIILTFTVGYQASKIMQDKEVCKIVLTYEASLFHFIDVGRRTGYHGTVSCLDDVCDAPRRD
jgi:hypothetical protein